MEEVPCIHLRGQLGSLGKSIIQRLLHYNVSIVLPERYHESVAKEFSVELEFSNSEILSSTCRNIFSGDRILLLGFNNYQVGSDDSMQGIGVDGAEVILVTPFQSNIEIDVDEIDSYIQIYDMIPHNSIPPWNSLLLDSFMQSLVDDSDVIEGQPPNWWVAEVDVADAISRLMISKNPTPTSIRISGRRSWSNSQTFSELEMLYSRTLAGKTGEFSISHLTSASTPEILVVPKEEIGLSSRPELKMLHDALINSDGEGWRPMTTLRAALMHYLAHHFEDS